MFATRTANSCHPRTEDGCNGVATRRSRLTHLPLPVFHPVPPLFHTPTQEYQIAKSKKKKKKFHPFLSCGYAITRLLLIL